MTASHQVHHGALTVGFSPKVWRPVAAQVVALLVLAIATGHLDRVTLAQSVGVILTLLLGIHAPVGTVRVPRPSEPPGR